MLNPAPAGTFVFLIVFAILACSTPKPAPTVSVKQTSWAQKIREAELHAKQSGLYYQAFRKSQNPAQLDNAMFDSLQRLRLLNNLQKEFPRSSDFAYQTLLKRLEACKFHRTLVEAAKNNLLDYEETYREYCVFNAD